jgi:hypothetical protein
MSLDEIEAYERERRLRSQRIQRALSWAPMGMAALLLAAGGLFLWSASSGHEADRAEVAVLVEERRTEAQEAEEEFHAGWTDALERSSAIHVERLESDGEAMHALLRETVLGEAAPAALAATGDEQPPALFEDLARDGVPGLDDASPARLGPFEPVLVGLEGNDYAYFAFVEIHEAGVEADPVATLSVAWSTDLEGAITEIDAHWTGGIPKRS